MGIRGSWVWGLGKLVELSATLGRPRSVRIGVAEVGMFRQRGMGMEGVAESE